MNVQEFSKLKTGDKIFNGLTNSHGRVTKETAGGVHVAWGGSPDSQARYFSVQGTSWFHWSKVDDGGPGAMRETPHSD